MWWSTLRKCTISVVGLKFWSLHYCNDLNNYNYDKYSRNTTNLFCYFQLHVSAHVVENNRIYLLNFGCAYHNSNCWEAQWGWILLKTLNNRWVIFDNAHKEKFIFCFLYNLVSISCCITLNARKTGAWWTGKYVQGSSLGLIAALPRHLPAVAEGKPVKLQAGCPASRWSSNRALAIWATLWMYFKWIRARGPFIPCSLFILPLGTM